MNNEWENHGADVQVVAWTGEVRMGRLYRTLQGLHGPVYEVGFPSRPGTIFPNVMADGAPVDVRRLRTDEPITFLGETTP